MVIARILLLCCLLPACAFAADARSKFREIWQDEWEWRLQQMPLFATSVGVHTYDDRLGEVSPAAQQERLVHWRKVLAALDRVKQADLGGATQVDYAIYRAQIESFIANIELGSPEMPMNSDSAFWSDLAMLPLFIG